LIEEGRIGKKKRDVLKSITGFYILLVILHVISYTAF